MTSWQSPPFIVANLICTRMGNDISSWRMSIGLFYGAMYGAITKRYIGKISFNTSFLFRILLYLRQRLLSVLHARIRNNCSDLNNDLVQNHLRNDPYCSCGNDIENAHHYFLNVYMTIN